MNLDTRQSEGPETQFSHIVTGSKSSRRICDKDTLICSLTCQQDANFGLHCVILSEEGVERTILRCFAHLERIIQGGYLQDHNPHLPALGLALLPGGVDDVVVQDPDEGVAAGLEAALSLSDAVFTCSQSW